MTIPFYRPSVDPATTGSAVRGVAESGWISPQGPETEGFESELAEYVGAEHVVATDSGTAAIGLGLRASGVGEGDEVLVPAYTFGATAAAVLAAGAAPVYVDVEPETLGMDPDAAADAITDRTAAVVTAHLFGHPSPVERLKAVADRHGILMVEDAAQALGATVGGEHAGTAGDIGCYSFSWNKPLTTGKGGALATDDPEIAAAAREIADYGREDGTFVRKGHNLRMDSFRAAIGREGLEALPDRLERKQGLFRRYHDDLEDVDGIRAMDPDGGPGIRPAPTFYVVRTDRRDELGEGLSERGIGTDSFYTPLPDLPAFPDSGRQFPVADRASRRVLGLPSSPGMDEATVDRVTAAVRDTLENA